MTGKSNRRWFQFHLSTAALMMVVAGVLIFLNVKEYHRQLYNEELAHEVFSNPGNGLSAKLLGLSYYGWPWTFYDERGANIFGYKIGQWSYHSLILDIASWAGILVLCFIASEFLLRRREARKP